MSAHTHITTCVRIAPVAQYWFDRKLTELNWYYNHIIIYSNTGVATPSFSAYTVCATVAAEQAAVVVANVVFT